MTRLFDRIYRPREGDRQRLHFTFETLRKYRAHRKAALDAAGSRKDGDVFLAFFGTADHYRRSGVVSLKSWKKYFGNSFQVYEGTHFMEDEPISEFLIPSILNVLDIK